MKQTLLSFAAIYALILGAASCDSTSTGPAPVRPPSTTTAGYQQVERLARPAIKEATENYADHATTNTVSPESATTDAKLASSIHDFATFVGRDEAHASTLVKILIPDEIAADLSDTTDTKAAYLGIETGGFTGSNFGGRSLQDDVIDTDLYAVFGTALSDLKLVPDDGKALPCLVTDNVSAAQGQASDNITPAAFPYVGAPH